MSTESMTPSKNLCCSLLLLPSTFHSIMVFSKELALRIRWPKYWNFSFSISLSNEYSGLISFRINWFNFLAVHGTLKSLLQHHNLKASILQHSAFLKAEPSYLYMTPGKTIVLTVQTFAGKVISLLFYVSSVYLRLLIFFLAILIPVCASSSLAFHMMYSAYKLNKQDLDFYCGEPCTAERRVFKNLYLFFKFC